MSMTKCLNCGKDISDTAKKCIHCGCEIAKSITCNECGKETLSTNNVCPNCGNKLKNGKLSMFKFANKKKLLITIILLIIVIAIIIVCVAGTSKVSLKKIYNKLDCSSYNCTLASDGSYLEIDTNPLDIDDYSSSTAINYIKKVNTELGFSESLFNRMGKTRALDGTLQEENKYVKVSWTYHPDDGLEVVYTLK